MYLTAKESAKVHLTPREAEMVFILMHGKSVFEVASSLCLSPRTIEFYLRNLRNKINCRDKNELIEIARDCGFVHRYQAQQNKDDLEALA